MKLGKQLIITIVLTLTLVACGDDSQPASPPAAVITPTTTPTPVPDWRKRWLQGIPCRLPCWEGITPGITSYDEALKLLSADKRITNIRTYSSNIPKTAYNNKAEELKVIEWSWGGLAQGEILTKSDGYEEVKYLRPGYGISFSLKEIMAAYGEPQFIQAYTQLDDVGQTYGLVLIFKDKGFAIDTGGIKPITLEESLTFRDFVIFGPDIENLKLQIVVRDEWLQSWQGFKDYDYSCWKIAYLINSCGKLPGKAP